MYKEDTKYLMQSLTLAPKFCLLYIGHTTTQFSLKRLCAQVVCECVRSDFLFEFFLSFQSTSLRCISNKIEDMHPKAKTPLTSVIVKFLHVAQCLRCAVEGGVASSMTE
jgi:hypothetical protein